MNLVLTGSSTGIGRALAEYLLSGGHHVWGIARSAQVDLAQRHADRFRASRCDVANWAQLAYAAKEVEKTWGHVDAVITCAGIQGEIGRALSADPANWSATIRTNLDGTFFTLRAFTPLLEKASRRAKMICFSGGGASQARPQFSAYGAAKTGIVRLVETIAAEERGEALDINAVAPGGINTRLTDEILTLGATVVGADEFATAQKQKASGGASVTKVCDLVDWLLSPASDGVSGRLISAQWDDWAALSGGEATKPDSDLYRLRRVTRSPAPGTPGS